MKLRARWWGTQNQGAHGCLPLVPQTTPLHHAEEEISKRFQQLRIKRLDMRCSRTSRCCEHASSRRGNTLRELRVIFTKEVPPMPDDKPKSVNLTAAA